jgi:hypothetical protein
VDGRALFVGANPDDVVVEPNLGFIEHAIAPDEAKTVMELWMGGLISKRTAYERLQRGEMASHERNFEEEQDEIDQNPPDLGEDPDQPDQPAP